MSENRPPAPENKMGVMPENRLLVTMALPLIISMLVQACYNIVDSVFVAQLSEDALTAVSMAGENTSRIPPRDVYSPGDSVTAAAW